MTFFEDERPKKSLAHEIGSDLSLLSGDELRSRISLLREEIMRLEAEYERKQAGRNAAENLFKS